MNRVSISILALLVAVTSAHAGDDKVVAVALFERAKELEKAGKVAEACPIFEASYRADPQLGALLNTANCHETIDRTATAWAEFRDALELAVRRGDYRAEYARSRIAALEPRLVRLTVSPPSTMPRDLTVMRGDVDITSLLGVDIVVDPGHHTITASAPGYKPWTTDVEVTRDRPREAIAIPVLVPRDGVPPTTPTKPKDAKPISLVPAAITSLRVAPATAKPATSHRRLWAVVIGGAGLATAAVGLGFGVHAQRSWDASRDPSHCNDANICTAEGTAEIATARRAATTSTWLVASGGALLVTAAVVWWTAPSRASERTTTIAPVLDPRSPGVSLSGSF